MTAQPKKSARPPPAGPGAPNRHRALISLAAVSLDTETTGLNVILDRVVSVAAVRIRDATVLRAESFQQLVKPDIPIPESSTAIHGITDAMVASAPGMAAVLPLLNDFCADGVIVGHNTAFDLAILRQESERCRKVWRDRPSLDTGLLAIALNPALGGGGLESIADWLGVAIEGRHTAPGDALVAAEIFIRLIPRLRDAGVRTLAEAQRFQETASGALSMQVAAGWFKTGVARRSAGGAATPAAAVLERIDSFPYRHRIVEFMSSPPVVVSAHTSLEEAAGRMHESGIGALLVGNPESEGGTAIITERDIVAAVAVSGNDALTSVCGLHGRPLNCLDQEAFVYQALGRMQRLRIWYLGVQDARGKVTGVVSARDLQQARTTHAILIGDRVATAMNAHELASAADELPALAAALLAEGVPAFEITAVISDVIRHVTARAAALAEQRLAAEGRGPAPVPWCLLVLGSAGRGESLLSPDQDNAIVYLGSPMHDPWFAELARCLIDILEEAGIPYCKGEVMANHSAWRRNLAGWGDEIQRWLTLESESSLQNINAFFDLEAVYGEPRIAFELRDISVKSAMVQDHTLGTLARAVARLRPPIGMFGRLELQNGRVDLKVGALLPLVTAARVLALSSGSSARTTPDRFREASAGTLLTAAEAETLIGIQEMVLDIVLKQQLQDLHDGIPVSNRVDVARLDGGTGRDLRHGLRHLDRFLKRVPEFRGHL